jgi:non-heme chloroperoxidase
MDTYADDLAELVAALDLRMPFTSALDRRRRGRALHRRHGTKRVAKAVLIGAFPADAQDRGEPGGCRWTCSTAACGVQADRSQFFKDLTLPFYGYNRPGRRSPKVCASPSGCRE